MNERSERIHTALNSLMKACNLQGESGTEKLFFILNEAIDDVDWNIVEQRHKDGLCYDVNCLLAEAIDNALGERAN